MSSPMKSQQNPGPCEGFDSFAGQRWLYPNNMPLRGYQKTAVEMALFKNAMIVLPTGFGKTFIAAVVMYNFYNWYPRGKIIFMAPTKPLVTQQIKECKKISGIPSSACIELTGLIGATKRTSLIEERRVIFATPQVIENDLRSGILPASMVRCIVIDECHKAQGNFAYVDIVRQLQEQNRNGFRILALSATPGSDIARVQQVMLNLYINEIMFRTEDSIDLMAYRNAKSTHAWVVELKQKHQSMVDRFIKITEPIFTSLYRAGLTFSADSIERAPKYPLIKFLKGDTGNYNPRNGVKMGTLKWQVGLGVSLLHQFELLTLYGLRVFYTSIQHTMLETRSNLKSFLAPNVDFEKIMIEIRDMFGEDVEPNSDKKSAKDLTQGHPKFIAVKDLLIKHFSENQDKQETRAIVFSKYRDSVIDIVQTLKSYEPLIKPAAFVGQSTAAKGLAGMSQREQAQIIGEFKSGVYNTMVATCVAEEGLDIGEVDLIIAYDTSSSTSTTQRRGRTGRKRCGNVHSLLTKGYEEKRLKKAGDARRAVEDQLYKKENYNGFKYRDAPRMVPSDINPLCLEMMISPVDDEPESATKPKRKRASKKEESLIETKKIKKGDKSMDDSVKKYLKTDGSMIGGGSQGEGKSSFTTANEFLSSDWPDSSPDQLWDD